MYDELIKRLRSEAVYLPKKFSKNAELLDVLMKAADAIEDLSCEAEEYKAAYRKEHNKRIAENRYLYDELTKVVKEKLLMTPMRIEVSEPHTDIGG